MRQYISVDGRPISASRGTARALVKLYKSYVNSSCSRHDITAPNDPFLFLHIFCPRGFYDVNVEPSKDDVLFSDESAVLSLSEELFKKCFGGTISSNSNNERLREFDCSTNPASGAGKHSETTELLSRNRSHPVSTIPSIISTAVANFAGPSSKNACNGGTTSPKKNNHGEIVSLPARNSPNRRYQGEESSMNPWTMAKGSNDPTNGGIFTDQGHAKFYLPTPSKEQHHADLRKQPADRVVAADEIEEPLSPALSHHASTQRDYSGVSPSRIRLQINRSPNAELRGVTAGDKRIRVDSPYLYDPQYDTEPEADTRHTMLNMPSQPGRDLLENSGILRRYSNDITVNGMQSTEEEDYDDDDEEEEEEAGNGQSISLSGHIPSRTHETVRQESTSRSTSPPKQLSLREAMDYEHRKRSAGHIWNSQPERERSRAQNRSYSSPHHNRYLAARMHLASASDPQTETAQNSQEPTTTTTTTTTLPVLKIGESNSRTQPIRPQQQFQQLQLSTGLRIKRIATSKLPLEKIPPGSEVHSLEGHLDGSCSAVSDSTKGISGTDEYIRRGTLPSGFAGLYESHSSDISHSWAERISHLMQRKEPHKEQEIQSILYTSIVDKLKKHH